MKKILILFIVVLGVFIPGAFSQEPEDGFTVSMDLVTNYIWRGAKQGSGPGLQPLLKFTSGAFTAGAWGCYYFLDSNHSEADLYAELSLGDFTISLQDYYFSGTNWWNAANHAFEIQGCYDFRKLSLMAGCVMNSGAGADGGDLYLEVCFRAGKVNLFTGAGTGWHTSNGNFRFCNLGLSTTRKIKITENFTLPLTGSLILNPDEERLFVVGIISL